IDEATLVDSTGTSHRGAVTLDTENEPARIVLDGTLQTGGAVLHLRFRGVLNDQLRGFYRSTYKDAVGDDKVIATTQFESTSARRAFPCWDEPDLKAVFAVTLVVAGDLPAPPHSTEGSRSHRRRG